MRAADQVATEAKVLALLTWASGQFNITNGMTADQMAYCAQEIVATVHGINLDDIDLCLRMAIRGEFGTTYNRMDTPTVFEWLKKYRSLRYAEAEKLNQEGENLYSLFNHPQMHDALKAVVDAYEARKTHETPPAVRRVTEWEKALQNEWDALPHKTEQDTDGLMSYGRTFHNLRIYRGKTYDFTGYCAKRLEEVSEADPIN